MASGLLLKKLIIPVAIAGGICLMVSFILADDRGDWFEAVLQGMAGTFIGILIAVLYVEHVQMEHERKEWKNVETTVHKRLARIDNYVYDTMERFSRAVGYRLGIEFLMEQLGPACHVQDQAVRLHLQHANEEELVWAAEELIEIPDQIDRVLDTYGRFIPVKEQELLLMLLDCAEKLTEILRIFKRESLRQQGSTNLRTEVEFASHPQVLLRNQLLFLYNLVIARRTRDYHS